MKWLAIVVILLLLAFVGSWWWAGRGQKPLTEADQAAAPGTFVQVSAGRLHVRTSGPEDGPVVVMVHGFSTPNFVFEQTAGALAAAGFRVIRFDHFGRGWSDRPAGPYDVDFYDRALLDLMDALSLDAPVGLVGLSMGGPIVAEFAASRPERVSSVALLVPAGLDTAGLDGAAGAIVRTPIIGDWFWRVLALPAMMRSPDYDPARLQPEARLQGDPFAQAAYRGYGEALLSTLRHMPMTGREETFRALARTGIPVRAIYGREDTTVLISSAEKLAAAMPDAGIRIIEDGGHALVLSHHADVSADLVNWFTTAP